MLQHLIVEQKGQHPQSQTTTCQGFAEALKVLGLANKYMILHKIQCQQIPNNGYQISSNQVLN